MNLAEHISAHRQSHQHAYLQARISPRLAGHAGHAGYELEEIPDRLVGATILQFGTIDQDDLPAGITEPEGRGGLVIEFQPADGSPPRRIVFAFTELGMWTDAEGETNQCYKERVWPLPE